MDQSERGRVSRRTFLVRGSVAAAGTGLAATAGVAGVAGVAGATPLTEEELAAAGDPMLVRVIDASTGEVEVLVGEEEHHVTDKALAAKVLRAAR
jgi:hypothetical protein